MKLTMLGTGHATVTKCYNTCFTLSENGQYFLVDGGGGNEILRILEEENIPLTDIHDLFVSHGHTDHVLGVIWVIRMIGQLIRGGKYQGELKVYCHRELKEIITGICTMTLEKKITDLFDDRIRFVVLEDGDEKNILGKSVRFFDICSTKMKQFGFVLFWEEPSGESDFGTRCGKLVFCGDEPLNEKLVGLAEDSDWMMHEAFCLYGERELFKPYEKHHSTVKDACELAEKLHVKNLILYHTEDTHIKERRKLYFLEGAPFFHGRLLVPKDREQLELWPSGSCDLPGRKNENCEKEAGTNAGSELLQNLDRLHTTEMGVQRIRRNLSLDPDQVVDWCRERIKNPDALISRQGKNWYVQADGCILTVNAYSYTIITAHKEKI